MKDPIKSARQKLFYENLMMTFCLPYSWFVYVNAKRRYFLQKERIIAALEANQQLVDSLDDAGFDLDDDTCVLSSIQILEDRSKISAQIDPEHVKRAILFNMTELLKDQSAFADEVSFQSINLTNSVLEIILTPTWMNSYVLCRSDINRCVIATCSIVTAIALTYQQLILHAII